MEERAVISFLMKFKKNTKKLQSFFESDYKPKKTFEIYKKI